MTYTPSKFPPAGALVWQGITNSGGANVGTGGVFLNVGESSDPSGIASTSGTVITVSKAGTYFIAAMSHTGGQVFGDSFVWRLEIYANGGNQGSRFASDTTPVNGNQGGGNSRAWATALVALGAGATIQVRATQTNQFFNVVAEDGNVELIFIPVLATPQ